MKTEIHPKYSDVKFVCACGASYIAGSTIDKDEFHTEICSACHPFFTGKQKLIDTSGRVDKFMAKRKKAEDKAAAEKAKEKAKRGEDDETVEEAIEEATEEKSAEETPTEE